MRSELKSKYNAPFCNFYYKLRFNDLIHKRNDYIFYAYISYNLEQFKLFLKTNETFIDDKFLSELLIKYELDEFYLIEYNLDRSIEDNNNLIIEAEKSKFLENFNDYLSTTNNFIDDDERFKIKSIYNKSYFNYYDELNFDDLIVKKNIDIIKSEKLIIKDEFNSFLLNNYNIITEDIILDLKSKYNKKYYNFYDELNFDDLINNHNNNLKLKIIRKELSYFDDIISDSKRNELKEKYSNIKIKWNQLINNFNNAYINNQASLKGKLSKNLKNLNLECNLRLNNDVYYIYDYAPKNFNTSDNNLIQIRRMLWDYKDGYEYAIDFFTKKLMDAILIISNRYLQNNIRKLALISIPPSKLHKNDKASMRKSIYRMKNSFNDNLNDFNNIQEVYDYGNLFFRCINVKSSHLNEKRPSYEEHLNSIICTRDNFLDENTAFILLDDVKTTGMIMNVCENILINNDVKDFVNNLDY